MNIIIIYGIDLVNTRVDDVVDEFEMFFVAASFLQRQHFITFNRKLIIIIIYDSMDIKAFGIIVFCI